ncbi:hypothetical protein LBMAG53_27460 [Planctomycetota bacterium]|nr:hypothetical protein LBMAG53_27460 [Planctomycetota bacterium]
MSPATPTASPTRGNPSVESSAELLSPTIAADASASGILDPRAASTTAKFRALCKLSHRALVADPDPEVQQLYSECLREHGCEVQVANTWPDAEEILRADPAIRLSVLDWSLPGRPSPFTLGQLRAADRGYLHIVVTMRRGSRELVAQAMEGGADDVLVKPFLYDVLIQRLRVGSRIAELEERLRKQNTRLANLHDLMRSELDAAARYQQHLLPVADPAAPGWAAAWRWRPCAGLGGDLLGFKRLADGRLSFHLLDVSGHGVGAALLAVQVQRSLAHDAPVAEPLPLLRWLNDHYRMDPHTRQYFTIVVGVADGRSGTIRFASAGHPGPLVVRQGGPVEHLATRGVAVGWIATDRTQWIEHTVDLAPGDRCCFYSDGVTEARSDLGFEFGRDRLARGLVRPALTTDAALDRVERELTDWSGERGLDDDMSLILLERIAN